MSRNVKIVSNPADPVNTGVASLSIGTVPFTVTRDADDLNILYFKKDSGIINEDHADYEFDLREFIFDFHNQPAINSDETIKTSLAPDYTDTDAPEVDEVVAKDRKTVRVFFNENIQAPVLANFVLKNYDLAKNVEITGVAVDGDNDNAVLLTLNGTLEARYEYELTVKKNAVSDFVQATPLKVKEETTWYFNGTNLKE